METAQVLLQLQQEQEEGAVIDALAACRNVRRPSRQITVGQMELSFISFFCSEYCSSSTSSSIGRFFSSSQAMSSLIIGSSFSVPEAVWYCAHLLQCPVGDQQARAGKCFRSDGILCPDLCVFLDNTSHLSFLVFCTASSPVFSAASHRILA